MIKLVILGAPGSGKGTHTFKIAERYNLKHIVVGDIVKQEIRDKTELGKIMYEYTSVGKFIPSDIVVDVLRKQAKDLKGFDGYIIDTAPINLEQKEAMSDFTIDGVIWLRIDDFDVIRKRILDRLICPKCRRVTSKTNSPDKICSHCGSVLEQRYDDNIETLNNRLVQYEEKTLKVIEEYQKQGIVLEINAEKSKDEVYAQICNKVDDFLNKKSLK